MLSVHNLKVHFPAQSGLLWKRRTEQGHQVVKAVDGISFDLKEGETLGIVGESGCGKSTLARALLRLIPATEGTVTLMGEDLFSLSKSSMHSLRRHVQMVFQDPLASLNPRMTIGEIIAEPLKTHFPHLGKEILGDRVREMMGKVGLHPEMINRYPHEFSGGQCQRIGIARAMILEPKLIVCDEPVSALDVSIRAQIINLLMQLQKEFGLSLIFISHDLSVVRVMCHRILVLYLGRPVELAPCDALYRMPGHPYTQALLSAVPSPDPKKERVTERVTLKGELPSPLNPPSGCVFHPRCPMTAPLCTRNAPFLLPVRPDHRIACHLSEHRDTTD